MPRRAERSTNLAVPLNVHKEWANVGSGQFTRAARCFTTMADKYRTGYIPDMTIQQLVSRANGNAFFLHTKSEARDRKKDAVERMLDRIDRLSAEQQTMLLAVLQGEATALRVDGDLCAAKKGEHAWWIGSFTCSSVVHVDLALTACSCDAAKPCSHIEALRTLCDYRPS